MNFTRTFGVVSCGGLSDKKNISRGKILLPTGLETINLFQEIPKILIQK